MVDFRFIGGCLFSFGVVGLVFALALFAKFWIGATSLATDVDGFWACLFHRSLQCRTLSGFVEGGQPMPYYPMMFWIPLAMVVAGIVLMMAVRSEA